MRKTVRRRYNKNGSITKSTTYSRKNMFGTRRITTYTQRSYPNNRGISTKIAINCIMIVTILIILGCYFLMMSHNIDYDIAVYFKITDIILLALLLLYDIPPLRTLCLFILKNWYKLICLFFRGIIKKITSEKDTAENKTELADIDFKDDNGEQVSVATQRAMQKAKNFLERENNNVDIDERRKIVDKSKVNLNIENGIMQNPGPVMISPYVVEPVDISVLLKEDDVRQAAVYAVEAGSAGVSVSYLQRKIKISYSRAARIMNTLEGMGIVGPFEGAKPRRVLVDKEWLDLQLENCALENKK